MSRRERNKVFSSLILALIIIFQFGAFYVKADTAVVPYVKNSKVKIDGVITESEYGGHYSDNKTGMTVYWEHNGTVLRIGLVSHGTGWEGIGLGLRGVGMDGANLILGYVAENGSVVLSDEIGVGRNHFPDTQKGGKYNILAKAGTEVNSVTTIEFMIPLDSGDPLDQRFQPGGVYGFFLGYSATAKDLTTYHTAYSEKLDVEIQSIPSIKPSPNGPDYTAYYLLAFVIAILAVVTLIHQLRRPKVIRFRPPAVAS